MRIGWVISLTVLWGSACRPSEDAMVRLQRDSLDVLHLRLAQAESLSRVKDSLVTDLAAATQLIIDIGTEIATVQSPQDVVGPRLAGAEGAQADERVALLGQVRDLTTRVRRSEARLSATRRRLEGLIARSDSTRFALSAYQQSLEDLTAIVESQKDRLGFLASQIDTLAARNLELVDRTAALEDTLTAAVLRANTVYMVAGTRKELLDRGIIQEEGGTRFLIFTRTGETLRPAATLDPKDFTPYDLRTDIDIPLPKADKEYAIVSPHDRVHLDPASLVGGKILGVLRIWNPRAFWAQSHFLILVEQ